MKFDEIKPRQIVEDTWYHAANPRNSWGVGKVVKVSKRTFTVKFSNPDANNSGDGLVTYDRSHAQFVRKYSRSKKAQAKKTRT